MMGDDVSCVHGTPPCDDCVDSEERFIHEAAKGCRDGCGLTCGDRPCAACLAGGVCDQSDCECEEFDPEERDYDPDEDRTP
jgi:hypothetical protein